MEIELELCRSNSLGSQFHAPTVVQSIYVPDEAAAGTELSTVRPNGYFVRRVPDDRTGNG